MFLDTRTPVAILPPLDGGDLGFLRPLLLGNGRGPDSGSLASLTNLPVSCHLLSSTSQRQASVREWGKGQDTR